MFVKITIDVVLMLSHIPKYPDPVPIYEAVYIDILMIDIFEKFAT
jgi:hypothetical protein